MPTLPVIKESTGTPIEADLQALAPGEIYFDRHHRLLYATDASNYQVTPLGVVTPANLAAAQRVVNYCGSHKVPLLPRGGGTSLAGQCVNRALVLDMTPHCRRIGTVDPAARTCEVEVGLAIDQLNRHLIAEKTGLFFAPDPATTAQAAIGGCIGNNAAGARSIVYGRTSENIAALEVVLSSGSRLWLKPRAGRDNADAKQLAAGVRDITLQYAEQIRQRFPKTIRRNAGYGLDMILSQLDRGVQVDDLDLTDLICGSEGTLAVVLSAVLKLHPAPAARGLGLMSFASLEAAIAAVPAILATGPSAVELLDDVVLEAAAGNAENRRYLELVPSVDGKLPRAVLYVEYQAVAAQERNATPSDVLTEAFQRLRNTVVSAPLVVYLDQADQLRAWALRKNGEPLLHNLGGDRKPLTLVEDNAIPVENLSRFVAGCKEIFAAHDTTAAYWAHASVGVLHIRPMLNLHDAADRRRTREIAIAVADLARECGGVMSGEHGDGRSRGPLLERFFGPELMEAFRKVKSLFDPAGILNPGMIVDIGGVETITENLRVRPAERDMPWPDVETYFDYVDQESFRGAVEMCNGAGVCRKTAVGTMCPSYRATLDERHATRGRANALRTALSGQLAPAADGKPAWDDPGTIETLDLCLSCKACKSECPSNVDLARLKAEYTAQRFRVTGRVPLQARAFGHIRTLNRLGSLAHGLVNVLMSIPPLRELAGDILGLAPQRSLPTFERSLYAWFAERQRTERRNHRSGPAAAPPALPADAPKVVLYADCFTTYNEPEIGRAATLVLEAFGYRVLLPRVGCCGRSMISTGLLADAVRTIERTLVQLRSFIDDPTVVAIVAAEPSCLAAIKDEWISLKVSTPIELRQRCAAKAFLVEEFLDRHWTRHPRIPAAFASSDRDPQDPAADPTRAHPADLSPVLLHAHCHQKALWGAETSSNLLARLLGPGLRVLPSGCCGMAGSFGFTKKHYDISRTIFQQSLGSHLAAASADATVLAPGTSCRHQLRDLAAARPLHPIEFVAGMLDDPFTVAR